MMERLYQSTAILIFANSPEEEMRQKSLVAAEKFYSELNRHTVEIVKRTKLPFYIYTEKEQHGDSFGDRFYNAINEVYGRGYEYVITLGNDTPQLTTAHLLNTLKKLYQGQLVLGPSLDGGFYLMGIHKSQFSELNFRDLPWQTADIRKAFSAEIRQNNFELKLLEFLSDIDKFQDLIRLVNRGILLPPYILQYFHFISASAFRAIPLIPNFSYTSSSPNYYNKGSPVSAGVQVL